MERYRVFNNSTHHTFLKIIQLTIYLYSLRNSIVTPTHIVDMACRIWGLGTTSTRLPPVNRQFHQRSLRTSFNTLPVGDWTPYLCMIRTIMILLQTQSAVSHSGSGILTNAGTNARTFGGSIFASNARLLWQSYTSCSAWRHSLDFASCIQSELSPEIFKMPRPHLLCPLQLLDCSLARWSSISADFLLHQRSIIWFHFSRKDVSA